MAAAARHFRNCASFRMIENSEIRYCYDREIKVDDGHAIFRSSHLYGNLRGGILVEPGGRCRSEHNLVEGNGKNGSGAVVRQEAAQLVAAPGDSHLFVDGDVVRDGVDIGIRFRANSSGDVGDTFVCGMDGNGIQGNSAAGSVQEIEVRGTATVFNDRGVQLFSNGSQVSEMDFGSSNDGGNAFVANAVFNFANASGSVQRDAEGNQWESCPDNSSSCLVVSSSDFEGQVDVLPAQAHRGGGPTINRVFPPAVTDESTLVWIMGAGFNAIEGYRGIAPATNCGNIDLGNRCGGSNGFHGTCVEFVLPGNVIREAEIVAITPRAIAVKPNVRCSSPIFVKVRRRNGSGVTVSSSLFPFCTNPQ